MRWLKHLTATHQDEKIARLLDAAGPLGYGVWWLILEAIGQQITREDPNRHSLTYSPRMWSHCLHVPPHLVRTRLEVLAGVGLVTLRYEEGEIEVSVPNILKYKDEYQKKSGEPTDSVGTKNENQNEHEKEHRTEPPKPPAQPSASLLEYPEAFENFWKAYPRKTGKGAALKAWKKIAPKNGLAERITESVAQHCQSFDWRKDSGQFIPHPATFLNQGRWEDEFPSDHQEIQPEESGGLTGLERSSDEWLDWAAKHPEQAKAGGYPVDRILQEIERRKDAADCPF